jgi:hypothetical protein
MLCGGGSKGPSAAEIAAQTEANRRLADAETARIKAESDAKQQEADAKTLAESVASANADQARRARNRTLLAGVAAEEGDQAFAPTPESSIDLEDPDAPSVKKAKRAKTLVAGF